jgi:hypothetical protein
MDPSTLTSEVCFGKICDGRGGERMGIGTEEEKKIKRVKLRRLFKKN